MNKSSKASKVYTRTGDKGKTSLIGGTRVSKGDVRLDAYGTIDELNSVIGVLIAQLTHDLGSIALTTDRDDLHATLTQIQCHLFDIGSQLACEDPKIRTRLPNVNATQIRALETKMDLYSENLAELRNFILPGGSRSAAYAHVARTVCRRAERLCVTMIEQHEPTIDIDPLLIQYLNRLSDYLFVLARHLNRLFGISEPIWKADAT